MEVVELCADYLENKIGKTKPVFGGAKIKSLPKEARLKQASELAPILRGFCSSQMKMIGHFTDDERVLEFINSNDLLKLAPMGISCPDHFLRTKISPLVLDLEVNEEIKDISILKQKIEPQFQEYRKMYTDYYNHCKHENSPPIRDTNPVVILYPGIGMFTFAKNKQTARVASEFYINAINVMKGAEAISEYTSLPRQEAFDIEYWLLEEAKLQRMPKAKPLSGHIALITVSAGGIGKAIAKKFADEGASIILSDNNAERLKHEMEEFSDQYGKDVFIAHVLDVTDIKTIQQTLNAAVLAFGGIDIIVNNAGLSISKPIEDHTESDWDLIYDVLVKGQFFVTQKGIEIMRKQGLGGDVLRHKKCCNRLTVQMSGQLLQKRVFGKEAP